MHCMEKKSQFSIKKMEMNRMSKNRIAKGSETNSQKWNFDCELLFPALRKKEEIVQQQSEWVTEQDC